VICAPRVHAYFSQQVDAVLAANGHIAADTKSIINQSINVKFAGRRYSLPADRVDFSSFAAFKQTIEQIDFSQFSFGYDN